MYSNLLSPGIALIAVGLLIIVFGVRIARFYAVLSALGLAVGIGALVFFLLTVVLRMAGKMLIPILIAIALAVLLLIWVGKAYMKYLKIYAILGLIKIVAGMIAICLILLSLQQGLLIAVIFATIAVVVWLIRAFAKWSHLLYMIGIITDGALIAVWGSILVGASAGFGMTIILAVLAIPLLIWTGLYRECWRQKIPFPGIQSW